jgi:aminocarboxymuconate-semialdehyde decarboxylase
MIGSDYPFDMGDADPLGSLDAAGLDPGTRGLIEGQTAAKFLRLPVS